MTRATEFDWYVRLVLLTMFGVPALCIAAIVSVAIESVMIPIRIERAQSMETAEALDSLLKDRDCFLAWQEPRLRQYGLAQYTAIGTALTADERRQCRQWPDEVLVLDFREEKHEPQRSAP